MKLLNWGRASVQPGKLTAFDLPASECEKVICAARAKLIHELDDDLRELAAGLGWRQGGLDDIVAAQMIRCARRRAI